MNRKQYRKIAKIHVVTVVEVKKEMQVAIDHAYKTPNFHARFAMKRIGEKPTVDEFIDYDTNEAKKKVGK